MAVYTDVGADELDAFLAGYDIGELLSYKGIAEGVENSNFLLHTAAGHFILTLYEKRVAAKDLPFFLGLMEHLAARGINCPQPVQNRKGEMLGKLAGRPAAIVTFLDGMWLRRADVKHCAAVGEALARTASCRRGFRDEARQCAVGRGLAAALRELLRARRRRAARPEGDHREGARPRSKNPGRAVCRTASSTPTCFPTTCSFSATNCPA